MPCGCESCLPHICLIPVLLGLHQSIRMRLQIAHVLQPCGWRLILNSGSQCKMLPVTQVLLLLWLGLEVQQKPGVGFVTSSHVSSRCRGVQFYSNVKPSTSGSDGCGGQRTCNVPKLERGEDWGWVGCDTHYFHPADWSSCPMWNQALPVIFWT